MTSPIPAHETRTGIHLSDVRVDVGGRRILDDVSVDLDASRIAVIGANGSGKSTFLRLLDGLMRPTSGTIRVRGFDPVRQARDLRRHVGFVFTDPDTQIVMPTVSEDLAFSLRGFGLSREEVHERVNAWLDEHGLADHANAPAHSLSGGQKQLLAIGAVLIRNPDLVLADEPTTLLDLPNAHRIRRLLTEQNDRQIIIATHDLELARACDQAVRFANGRIVAVDRPEAIIDAYRREFA